MDKAVVAIVGRPNTGKSTLFNALAGKRLAIVGPEPGVTRDRIMTTADWNGREFIIIDTGGIETKSKDSLQALMHKQVEIAVEMADVICFLTDIKMGISSVDHDIARELHRSGKPVVLAVNKIDRPGRIPPEYYSFYELGFAETIPISSTHKLGISDLLDALVKHLPAEQEISNNEDEIAISILGKPNVGKSSLANLLIGEERSIVSNIPGTTRDSLDSEIVRAGQKYRFIDTAGLRRKSKIDNSIEYVSSLRSRQAVDRCEIALIMIDALEGPTSQDSKIAGLAHQAGKASIFIVNKWDLKDSLITTEEEYKEIIRNYFNFMPYAPIIFMSAKEGIGLETLWSSIDLVYDSYYRRVSTAMLNEVIADAIVMHPPPQSKGKQLKIYYATMTNVAPPNIIFFINDIKLLHFSYERYLENRLRENFSFVGTPIIMHWKGKAARKRDKSVITPD